MLIDKKANQKKQVFLKDKILVETSYDITAVDNRMLYFIMYNAQMRKNSEIHCVIDKKAFFEIIGSKGDKNTNYIMNSLERLKETNYKFWQNAIIGSYKLIGGWQFNKETEKFEIYIPSVVYNRLMDYEVYAPLNLNIIKSLKSFYSQRLYDLFRLWSRTDTKIEVSFKIEYIRFILGLDEDVHKEFKHLNQCVKTAVKDIEKKTNMQITCDIIRQGRKASKFHFTILDNEQKTYFSNKNKESEKNIIPEGVNLTKTVLKEFKNDFEGYDFKDKYFETALKNVFIKTTESLKCKTIGTKQYGYFKQVLEEDICELEKYDLIVRNI